MKTLKTLSIISALYLTLFAYQEVYAHQTSDSYLKIQNSVGGGGNIYSSRWHLGLQNLDMAIDLDQNNDGNILWGEILSADTRIRQYALKSLTVSSNEQLCTLNIDSLKMEKLNSGMFVVLDMIINCLYSNQPNTSLAVKYEPFFNIDLSHRGIVTYVDGITEQVLVAGPNNTLIDFDKNNTSTLTTLVQFIIEGVWHIWIGYDHILFLIALLLPSMLYRKNNEWQTHNQVKPMVIDVLKIVTMFTLAHSITLIAGINGWINVPINLVETLIAISIIISGMHLLFPVALTYRWLFSFSFGLIHGLGFASVLGDLSLTESSFWNSIIGFNIGVEIGQLAIVLVILPLLYMARFSRIYQYWVMPSGATIMILAGSFWAVERGLG